MLSRRKADHDPDLGNWSYTYYLNGWLKTQTDLITYGNGVTANFTYDFQRGWPGRVQTRRARPS
jgi:hypothetical protein